MDLLSYFSGSVKLLSIRCFAETRIPEGKVKKPSQVTETFRRPGGIFHLISEPTLKSLFLNTVFKKQRKCQIYKIPFAAYYCTIWCHRLTGCFTFQCDHHCFIENAFSPSYRENEEGTLTPPKNAFPWFILVYFLVYVKIKLCQEEKKWAY